MARSTVSVSSVGTSRPVALDWMSGAPTRVSVTGSSSGTFAYTIQFSLDDLQTTAPAAVTWISDANATALTSNSSVAFNYTAPIAAIRINSSALSSAALSVEITQAFR
jgi:hypothetical protein